jgi:4-hydroxythreonine-4-phosphate dehydrogenase
VTRLVVVADDLTGAADSAALLTRLGLTSVVLEAEGEWPDDDVLAVDTDIRHRDPLPAAARVAETTRRARGLGARVVKKVDSTLRGHVEFPEHKAALTNLFKYLALEVNDQVELLPSAALDEKRFGVVTAERTFVRSRPVAPGTATRSENLTDCAQGDLIFLLKEAEHGQLLCHAPDGYVGYVAAADVRQIDEKEFARLNNAPAVRHPQGQHLWPGEGGVRRVLDPVVTCGADPCGPSGLVISRVIGVAWGQFPVPSTRNPFP